MKRILILSFWFYFCNLYGQSHAMHFTPYIIDKNINQEYITSIVKDKDGTFWIGALGALYKVSNDSTTSYHLFHDNGIIDKSFCEIAIDQSGRIWAYTSKRTYVYEKSADTFVEVTPDYFDFIGIDEWDNILFDNNEVPWIIRNDTLYKISPSHYESYHCVDSLLTITNSIGWLVGGDIVKFKENGDIEPLFKTNVSGNTHGGSLSMSNGGSLLWIYDRYTPGMECYDVKDRRPIELPNIISKDNIITKLIAIGDKVAITTNNSGLIIFTPSSGELVQYRYGDEEGGLPSNHLTSLFFDNNMGQLYIGSTKEGVSVCEPLMPAVKEVVTSINEDINCFVKSAEDILYIGFDGGGIGCFNDREEFIKQLTISSEGISSNVVTFMMSYKDKMLCATYGNGLFLFDGEKMFPMEACGLMSPLSRARSMGLDKNGDIWIASFSKGVGKYSSDSLKMFNTTNSALKTNYITDLKVSPDKSSVYVATGYGLYKINVDSDQSQEISLSDEDKRPYINCMTFDAGGNLWIATSDGLRVMNRTIVGLPSGNFIALTSDDNYVYATDKNRLLCMKLNGEVGEWSLLYSSPEDLSFKFNKYALYSAGNSIYAGGLGKYLVIGKDGNVSGSNHGVLWCLIGFGTLVTTLIAVTGIRRYRRRKLLQNRPNSTAGNHITEEPLCYGEKEEEVSVIESDFVKKLNDIALENISDSDFSMDNFSAAMGMSRSNLYKKMMAVIGKSPLEFIIDKRIEQGRSLLVQSQKSKLSLSISEIAYKVGMSPKQFSKYYKARYGCRPSEDKGNNPEGV